MMNDSFGTRLRRERERRQITLAQIADTTKIKASLFESLERDNVSRWPSGIFRRSFIRAYAQAIGLDPESTCREFVQRFPEPGDAPPEPANASVPGGGARDTTPTHVTRLAIARGAGVVAFAAGADLEGGGTLRLTLADTDLSPVPRRRKDTDFQTDGPGSRWRTVALDFGTVLAVALTAFIALDRFWMPLAVTSVLYFVVSSLVFGTTPAVLFFANAPVSDGTPPTAAAITSLDRALEMRDILRGDARPRSVTPALHGPVDIGARRVRA